MSKSHTGQSNNHHNHQANGNQQQVFLIALLAGVCAIFLAGGPDQIGLGIIMATVGLLMLFFKPYYATPKPIAILAGILVVCFFLTFLPSGLPAGEPEWLSKLKENELIPLGPQLSVMPKLTLFWAIYASLVIVFLVYLLSRGGATKQLYVVCWAFAIAGALYAGLAMLHQRGVISYPFDQITTYGFFPNRNHTATLLFTTAVTSCGLILYSFTRTKFVAGAAAIVCFLLSSGGLLFFSESRAGIVFLAVGIAIWLGGLGRKHLDFRIALTCGILALSVAIVFFSSDSTAKQRIIETVEVADTGDQQSNADEQQADGYGLDITTFDYRTKVFADTLKMWLARPFQGFGLGTFQYVFPQYRDLSLLHSVNVHPESDLLLLLSETGIFAVVSLLAIVVLLALRLKNGQRSSHWPLRWALVSAFAIALLHALVDVPFHRAALGFTLGVIGMLPFCINNRKEPHQPAGLAAKLVFRVSGGLALLVGLYMIAGSWFLQQPMAPWEYVTAKQELEQLLDDSEYEEIIDYADAAIQQMPMIHQLYYWKAAGLLRFEGTDEEAMSLLRAGREVQPNWPTMALEQGYLFIKIDPLVTAELWRIALRRALKIDAVRASTTNSQPLTYNILVNSIRRSGGNSSLQFALRNVVSEYPQLYVAWLLRCSDQVASGEFNLEREMIIGLLDQIPDSQAQAIIRRWLKVGDRAAAVAWLEQQMEIPSAKHKYWYLLASSYAQDKMYQEAVMLAADAEAISIPPAWASLETPVWSLSQFGRKLNQLVQDGNHVAVERILNESLEDKKLAKEAHQGLAGMLAQEGKWQQAWQHVRKAR